MIHLPNNQVLNRLPYRFDEHHTIMGLAKNADGELQCLMRRDDRNESFWVDLKDLAHWSWMEQQMR